MLEAWQIDCKSLKRYSRQARHLLGSVRPPPATAATKGGIKHPAKLLRVHLHVADRISVREMRHFHVAGTSEHRCTSTHINFLVTVVSRVDSSGVYVLVLNSPLPVLPFAAIDDMTSTVKLTSFVEFSLWIIRRELKYSYTRTGTAPVRSFTVRSRVGRNFSLFPFVAVRILCSYSLSV